ncbi:MAG: hypothetical protein KJ064_13585 [Anaerolineae bacterium]|nr:hypothetical protein [Anaerolineae bacterium]
MSRVVNPDNPGKKRNQNRRSCAEILRHLSQKSSMDDESRDMLATLVFLLRDIHEGLEDSAAAWEKRDYWIKAEQFRQRWAWVQLAEHRLEMLIRGEDWDKVPQEIVKLIPNFADINITKFTRDSELWNGKYQELLDESRTSQR